MSAPAEPIILGRIVGSYGVRGWVKIHSDCRPPEALFQYKRFSIGQNQYLQLQQGRWQGKALVAKFAGVEDMNQAEALRGRTLAVSELKPARRGEYYWRDLIGLQVFNREGEALGVVKELFETGANDVLVVEQDGRQRLIPYAMPQYIEAIDLAAGTMRVDWQASWDD